MRIWTGLLALAVFCTLAHSASAADQHAAPRQSTTAAQTARNPAAMVPVSLSEPRAAARGRVALCANLAGIRAMAARAGGVDYTGQSRIADLTFALCLAGATVNS